jgi:LysM repeat protein
MVVLVAAALPSGCASSSNPSMATGSLPPRPAEGMVREPARPSGGYGLGTSRADRTAGHYSWNGNPNRIQEGAVPPPAAPPPPAVAANGQRTITVRPGDTLFSLARHYRVSVAEMAEANGLMTPSIKSGQVLVLPPSAR